MALLIVHLEFNLAPTSNSKILHLNVWIVPLSLWPGRFGAQFILSFSILCRLSLAHTHSGENWSSLAEGKMRRNSNTVKQVHLFGTLTARYSAGWPPHNRVAASSASHNQAFKPQRIKKKYPQKHPVHNLCYTGARVAPHRPPAFSACNSEPPILGLPQQTPNPASNAASKASPNPTNLIKLVSIQRLKI